MTMVYPSQFCLWERGKALRNSENLDQWFEFLSPFADSMTLANSFSYFETMFYSSVRSKLKYEFSNK